MGLTHSSVGRGALDSNIDLTDLESGEFIIALAGNPNVGKSTIFNRLTGMNQHTGNWPGKTVASASGRFCTEKNSYILVDLPGTYSLIAHSPEEEVARDFICFGAADAVMVVCDATCLERNMNLVLQTLEITQNVLVCVNLIDEAGRKKINIDLERLSVRLGVPVIGTVGRNKKSTKKLLSALDSFAAAQKNRSPNVCRVVYPEPIEGALAEIEAAAESFFDGRKISRYIAMRLLDGTMDEKLKHELGGDFFADGNISSAIETARAYIADAGIGSEQLGDIIAGALVGMAADIAADCVSVESGKYDGFDRKLDRLFTGKLFGYPIMILFFAFIFWLTITGANYPSELLSRLLFSLEVPLSHLCELIHMPKWLYGLLITGAYRVLAWVVSVMLPPMAIFFPLFTLLEDAGYLPRIAYNLDKPFRKCNACGKQALTMCMGFGCNAAGVVGCRIIDSPRERLLAILTNSFVPCNGRYPTLILLITMFFMYGYGGMGSSLLSALFLTLIIGFGVLMTFLTTKLLSSTLLRGIPSSFTFELPPYRRPEVGRVIIRSIFDRTLFVLGRSAAVAAPAGALIWVLANMEIGGSSLLLRIADILDPLGTLMGLDGVILLGFILGFPANEIVLPIIIMIYTASGVLSDLGSITQMRELLISNGWSWVTAVNMTLFSLMHWPCSTTLLTIKKETGSVKWTVLAAVLPTLAGMVTCIIFTAAVRLFI